MAWFLISIAIIGIIFSKLMGSSKPKKIDKIDDGKDDLDISIQITRPSDKELIQQINKDSTPEFKKLIQKVILLEWIKRNDIPYDEDSYPVYLKYDYGIENKKELIKTLLSEDYLEIISLKMLLMSQKLNQLKPLFQKYHIKIKSKKEELIDSLLGILPQKEKEELYKNLFTGKNKLTISKKGFQLMKDNDWIIFLKKNKDYGISHSEFINFRNKIPFKAFTNDVIWGIFNERVLNYTNGKNWGFLRNNFSNMAHLLYKEKKEKERALFLLTVIYYDLSGMYNNNLYIKPEVHGWEENTVLEFKDIYTDDFIDNMYGKYGYVLPYHHYGLETFKKIIRDMKEEKFSDLKRYKKVTDKPPEMSF